MASADVEIYAALDRPRAALIDALKQQGFAMRTEDESFVEQTRVLPLLHAPTGIPVDVVLAGPGIEQVFFDGVIELDIENLMVPVARAEDIVVMKVLSARAKDLEDVAAILTAQRGSFDEQHVRELLGILEQALDQSDLLPTFERCLERVAGDRSE